MANKYIANRVKEAACTVLVAILLWLIRVKHG